MQEQEDIIKELIRPCYVAIIGFTFDIEALSNNARIIPFLTRPASNHELDEHRISCSHNCKKKKER